MYKPMRFVDRLAQITLSEDSSRKFKAGIGNAESMAAEMAAFANSAGGTISIGVADGGPHDLALEDVNRINQLISNAASQLVRSPLTVLTENVVLESNRIVIVLRFRDFLGDVYKRELPEAADELMTNAENIASTVASLSQVLAWLVTQERVSLAALRSQLLPLDQFPGAFIDELNERALDLTGDIALEESGEEIIIAKEVLFEVIANLE